MDVRVLAHDALAASAFAVDENSDQVAHSARRHLPAKAIDTHTRAHTHTHTRTRTRTHAHSHTHAHTHTQPHTRTQPRTHSHTLTHAALAHSRARTVRAGTHAPTHARTHARISGTNERGTRVVPEGLAMHLGPSRRRRTQPTRAISAPLPHRARPVLLRVPCEYSQRGYLRPQARSTATRWT